MLKNISVSITIAYSVYKTSTIYYSLSLQEHLEMVVDPYFLFEQRIKLREHTVYFDFG